LLKDKYIHKKLGIPIQTLQNWKKAEGHTFLLYNLLVSQNKNSFDLSVQFVLDQTGYKLIEIHELVNLVKENWNKIEKYSHYKIVEADSPDEWQYLAAIDENGNESLVIRFISGMFDKEEKLKKDAEKINNLFDEADLPRPKVVYVVNTIKKAKYFTSEKNNYKDYISIITYADMIKKFTNDKIIII